MDYNLKKSLLKSSLLLSIVSLYALNEVNVEATTNSEENVVVVTQDKAENQMIADNQVQNQVTSVNSEENAHATKSIGKDLISLSTEKPQVAPVEINDTPNRVSVHLSETPDSSMNFNWFSSNEKRDAKVIIADNSNFDSAREYTADAQALTSKYGEKDANGNYIFSTQFTDENGQIQTGYYTDAQLSIDNQTWLGSTGDTNNTQDAEEYVYSTQATGLKPSTKYYYQIINDESHKGEIGTFETAGEKGDPFTFIHYTDPQVAWWTENLTDEASYTKDVLEKANSIAPETKFYINTGDIVEIPKREDEWVSIMDAMSSTIQNKPHVFVAGNHDGEGTFNTHTGAPAANGAINEGSYYSFDYNGARFIILNTDDDTVSPDNPNGAAIGHKQMAWFEDELKKAQADKSNWIIVAGHRPIVSGSYHSLQDSTVERNRKQLMQLVDKYDVDIVLNGHDHVLSTTKPLVYSEEDFGNITVSQTPVKYLGEDGVERFVNPNGTVFFNPNTTGTKAYNDVFNHGIDYLRKVRPALSYMTQKDLDHWNSLFEFSDQPNSSEAFVNSHTNNRDATIQNFMKYTVTEDNITVEVYEVSGDLAKGEERKVRKLTTLGISKKEDFVPSYTLTNPIAMPSPKSDGRGEAIEHLIAHYGKDYENDPYLKDFVKAGRGWLWNEAYTGLNKFVNDNPRYLDAYRLQAELYLANLEFDEAISQLDKILAQYPNDTHALAMTSMIQIMRGNTDDAKARKNDLEKISPQYAADLENVYNTVHKYHAQFENFSGEPLTNMTPDLLVVFGHSPNADGTLQPTLENKVIKAKELSERFPDAKIMVTGGPVRQEISEAKAMNDWLVQNGVDQNRIVLDELARDTYGNAVAIIDYMQENNNSNVMGITNHDHIVRALSNLDLRAKNENYPIKIDGVAVNGPVSQSTMENNMPYVYYNALKAAGMVEKTYYEHGTYSNILDKDPFKEEEQALGLEIDPVDGYNLISRIEDFEVIEFNPDENFRLANDIDASDYNYTPISTFNGILDGDNYTISNLVIETDSGHAAMIRRMNADSVVKNLNVENAKVVAQDGNAAVIVEDVHGLVENVHVKGTTSGTDTVGGIAARTNRAGSIVDTHFKGSVTSTGNYAGGTVAYIRKNSEGKIEGNSVNATVTANNARSVGGIAGRVMDSPQLVIKDNLFTGTVNGKTQVAAIAGMGKSGLQNNLIIDATVNQNGGNKESNTRAAFISGWHNFDELNYNGNVVVSGSLVTQSRANSAINNGSGTEINNFVSDKVKVEINDNPVESTPLDPSDDNHGKVIPLTEMTKDFYEGIGFDFSDNGYWAWDDQNQIPILKNGFENHKPRPYNLSEPLPRPEAPADNDRAEALIELLPLYGLDYENDPLLKPAVMASRSYQWHDAYTMLDKVAQENPEHMDTYRLQAELYMNKSNYPEALSQLDLILDKDPDDLHALSQSIIVLRALDNEEGVQERLAHLSGLNQDLADKLNQLMDKTYENQMKVFSPEPTEDFQLDAIAVYGQSPTADGKPSSGMLNRLNRVLEMYKQYPDVQIITTGGPVRYQYAEADVMKEWLVEQGVDESKVYAYSNTRDRAGNSWMIVDHMINNNLKNLLVVSRLNELPRDSSYIDEYADYRNYDLNVDYAGFSGQPGEARRNRDYPQTLTIAAISGHLFTKGDIQDFVEGVSPALPILDLATQTPGTETPGTETPGTETPGAETPGTETPGSETPGTETPGTETPGAETPGTENPGTETPGTEVSDEKEFVAIELSNGLTAHVESLDLGHITVELVDNNDEATIALNVDGEYVLFKINYLDENGVEATPPHPVTIRLPYNIHKEVVEVVHLGDKYETRESLSYTTKNGYIEFTVADFSYFAVVYAGSSSKNNHTQNKDETGSESKSNILNAGVNSSVQKSLPKTGTLGINLSLSAFSILTGLGLVIDSKKRN